MSDITLIRAYAMANYCRGWDALVEAADDTDIRAIVGDGHVARSPQNALALIRQSGWVECSGSAGDTLTTFCDVLGFDCTSPAGRVLDALYVEGVRGLAVFDAALLDETASCVRARRSTPIYGYAVQLIDELAAVLERAVCERL